MMFVVPMKYFTYSISFNKVRRYLLAGVLASLCLAFNANLNCPAVDGSGQGDASTSMHGEAASRITHALTNGAVAHSERPAAAQYRGKRQMAQLATLPPDNFSVLFATAQKHSQAGGASVSYSSFANSQLRGRAPPRTA
jgi:hypothetical protein